MAGELPKAFASVDELDDFLITASRILIDDLAAVDGGILILDGDGKMGPTRAAGSD